MTRMISTATARRTLISTLAMLVLMGAPEVSFAHSAIEAEMWNVNPAKSSVNTLSLDRMAGKPGNPAASTYLIVDGRKIYIAGKGGKVQIGHHVRSKDLCNFRCQAGLSQRHRTLTYTAQAPRPGAPKIASNQ